MMYCVVFKHRYDIDTAAASITDSHISNSNNTVLSSDQRVRKLLCSTMVDLFLKWAKYANDVRNAIESARAAPPVVGKNAPSCLTVDVNLGWYCKKDLKPSVNHTTDDTAPAPPSKISTSRHVNMSV